MLERVLARAPVRREQRRGLVVALEEQRDIEEDVGRRLDVGGLEVVGDFDIGLGGDAMAHEVHKGRIVDLLMRHDVPCEGRPPDTPLLREPR